MEEIKSVFRYENLIYCILLDKFPDNIDRLRGKFGYFYEFEASEINKIAHIVNSKFQTLTYFGINKLSLIKFVLQNRLYGIDNIVPIGSALNIGTFWDGYDIVRCLSRTICVN